MTAFSLDSKAKEWTLAAPDAPSESRRHHAFARYTSLGLPTTKTESWHYTSLSPLRAAAPVLASAGEAKPEAIEALRDAQAAAELVIVDGVFNASLSRLPSQKGISVRSLKALENAHDLPQDFDTLVSWDSDGMASLNAAFWQDGVCITVDDGVAVVGVLQLIHIHTASSLSAVRHHTRHVIRVGKHARLHLYERWLCPDDAQHWATSAVEVKVDDGGHLAYDTNVYFGEANGLIRQRYIDVGRDAKLECADMILGGRLVRNENQIILSGSGGTADLSVVSVVKSNTHHDHRMVVKHAGAHTVSRVKGRAVAAGKGRAVLDALAIVDVGVVDSNIDQDVRGLLASPRAEIDVRPQLEIYADEVAARHGATVGQLDETARFYLRSRGIPDHLARRLLVKAFLASAETPRITSASQAMHQRLDRFVDDALEDVS